MKVSILNISTSTKTASTGKPYQVAEVAYKNLDSGKVESTNVFGFHPVFKRVVEMAPGRFYDVTKAQNAKGYWEWSNVQEGSAPEAGAQIQEMPAARTQAAPRSNFETPEERAARQVLIVRQSSLSNALEYLKSGTKAPPSVDQVLLIAQQFTDWVFDTKKTDLFTQPNDEPEVK